MNIKDNLGVIGNMIFTSVILLVIVWALMESTQWPYEARILPQIIGVPAAALCVAIFALDLWRLWRPSTRTSRAMVMDIQADSDMPLSVVAFRATVMFGWVLGFFAITWLLGFLLSVPLFVFLYLLVQGREKWWVAALSSAAMFMFTAGVFHFVLHVTWMRGAVPGPQQTLIDWLNRLY